MAADRSSPAEWEAYLDNMFPAYLLSTSLRQAIDVESARRFLRGLGVDADIEDLANAALIAGHVRDLQRFVRELAEWVRVLPSRTLPRRRVWDGGYHGRLSIAETMSYRLAGMPTRFVTVSRERSFDVPESLLVRAVTERLAGVLAGLRRTGMLDNEDWGHEVLACEGKLTHVLHSSALRKVPLVRISGVHRQAAQAARHPCYESARRWHGWMEDALDRHDEHRLAEILAKGALQPADIHKRFEVAVLLSLVQAMADACAPEMWNIEYGLVRRKRKDVACFTRTDGSYKVKVYYEQPILPQRSPPGPRARGVEHYIYTPRGQRPDITVVIEPAGQLPVAMVIEIKNSSAHAYQAQGYGEALLYRYEYADELIEWPKAVLVCSGKLKGKQLSREHEVVAVDWSGWVPDELVDVLLPSD